jgi:hypothetical protein
MQTGRIARDVGYDFSNPFCAHESILDQYISVSTISVSSNSDNIP